MGLPLDDGDKQEVEGYNKPYEGGNIMAVGWLNFKHGLEFYTLGRDLHSLFLE